MGEQSRRSLRSRGASYVLAVVGAILALIGGFLLYARQELFHPDSLAERARAALDDERTRLAIAQPIVDGIVDSGSGELVNARPFIESIVVSALGTPPVKAAFTEAVKAVDTKLADRTPNTLLLNLTDATVLAAKALDALAPQLAKGVVPKEITDVKAAILDSEITITPLRWVRAVDVFGIVLPILAALLLAASVAVAPVRRTGVQRAAIAIAAAAVLGLIVILVGRSLALGQIDDPLFRDAAGAVWDAILGDLVTWTLGIGLLALLLAAAARFGAGEIDPLAPITRAAALARSHPSRPILGVLRALAIGAVGVWMILAPISALTAFAVLAGAWLVYVAIIETLAILAPVEARRGAAPRRRFQPTRLAIAGALLVGVLVVVLVVGGENRTEARPPGPPEACNGYRELCGKRIDQVTFPATHNSMSAAAEAGWFLPNQRYGITRQLDDGIRGLLIDTHYGVPRGTGRGFGEVITDLDKENKTRKEVVAELGEETVERAEDLVGQLAFSGAPQGKAKPYLCHVLCELGATPLDDALARIKSWMDAHPDEFLIIFIEDVVSPEETARAFERSGLVRYAWTPEPDTVWPTLGSLIEQDKRLLVMAENDAGNGRFPWYQEGFRDLVQETPYTFDSAKQISGWSSCRPNRGDPSNPLFLINNWIEKIPRDPKLQGRINSYRTLLDRAHECTRRRGMKPNIIAVDYYNEGDLLGVANTLNGVAADATPTVRTTR